MVIVKVVAGAGGAGAVLSVMTSSFKKFISAIFSTLSIDSHTILLKIC